MKTFSKSSLAISIALSAASWIHATDTLAADGVYLDSAYEGDFSDEELSAIAARRLAELGVQTPEAFGLLRTDCGIATGICDTASISAVSVDDLEVGGAADLSIRSVQDILKDSPYVAFRMEPPAPGENQEQQKAPARAQSSNWYLSSSIEQGRAQAQEYDRSQDSQQHQSGDSKPGGSSAGESNGGLTQAPRSQSNNASARKILSPFAKIPLLFVPTRPHPKKQGWDYKASFKQSFLFISIQTAVRMTEDKTRAELGGPFFSDWGKSISALADGHYGDGGKVFTNYGAHGIQGKMYLEQFIMNNSHYKNLQFSFSKQYFKGIGYGTIYAFFMSAEFELGPISEASLGNVGRKNPKAMGLQDLIQTPLLGAGYKVAFDALDRYGIAPLERKIPYRPLALTIRVLGDLPRAFNNMLNGHAPSYRETRR